MTMNLSAIVLKGEDVREHDRRLVLYTRERGKLEVLAKGLRKMESKLAAHLEPLTTTEAFLIEGRHGVLIGGSVVRYPRHELRGALQRLGVAGRIVQLIDRLTPLEHRDERVYDLLDTTLTFIESADLTVPEQRLMTHMFGWKFVNFSGYRPQLKRCLACRRSVTVAAIYFNPRRGGVIHQGCLGEERSSSLAISLEALKGLTYMVEAPLTDICRLKGSQRAFSEMSHMVELVVEERFEIEAGSHFWRTDI